MNHWMDIPTNEIAVNLDTGEVRHWDREIVERKGFSGNWKWLSQLDKRELIDLMQIPDVCSRYHSLEPMRSDQPDGPFITLSDKQIRKMGEYANADASYRIHYRGSGYWWIERLDAYGEPEGDGRLIFSLET